MSLCGKCGKEILPEEEEYIEVSGEQILLPHKKCREEIQKQMEAYPKEGEKRP